LYYDSDLLYGTQEEEIPMTRSRLWVLALVVGLILPLAVSTAQEGEQRTGFRPDAPPYAIRGPYTVGTMDFVLDEDPDRPIIGAIWYPASNLDGAPEETTYVIDVPDFMPEAFRYVDGQAIHDAAPETTGAPYPLVVWSPGSGATHFYNPYLAEHLASQGFVVIALSHPGNAIRDTIMASTSDEANETFLMAGATNLVTRPRDISQIIDYATTLSESDETLTGMIDLEHIAVAGHSYGGTAAFAIGGARLDLDGMREDYANATDLSWAAKGNERENGIFAYLDEIVAAAGLDAAPEGLWPAMSDSRVDAIVGVGPALDFFGPEGSSYVSVPGMFLFGTLDSEETEELAFYRPYESLPVPRAMVQFDNADHYIFGMCGDVWLSTDFAYTCMDSVWDMDRTHDLTDHFVTAFLLYELKGDEEAHAALMPDAVSFPGVEYDAQGL
jgi:predicted dienelactone hydrolase